MGECGASGGLIQSCGRRYVLLMSRESYPPTDPKRLKFLALVAIKEVVNQRYLGPVDQSAALRLVLAYLHSVSHTERRIFDEFWKLCLPTNSRDDGYIGGTYMSGCWEAMARGAGIPLTIEMMKRFDTVARSPERDTFASRMKKPAE